LQGQVVNVTIRLFNESFLKKSIASKGKCHCEAFRMGAATISPFKRAKRDRFVASLLAMKGEWIAIAGIDEGF